MMKRSVLFLALLFGSFYLPILSAQTENPGLADAFQPGGSYTADLVNNLSGGIKTGSGLLGMASVHLLFDSESGGLWKGTQLYINGAWTHGASPSEEFFGDLQVASNIEAGNHLYLQELWLKQTFGRIELTLGLQDLNIEFAKSDRGSLFLNSSFGVLPIISGNIPAPIFPLTTPGVTVKWRLNKKYSILAAVYDGCPTEFNYNPYNVKWKFSPDDGLLAISELQHTLKFDELEGSYKIGVYTHNHFNKIKSGSEFADTARNSTFGTYLYADQALWQGAQRTLGIFTQLGYSPSKSSMDKAYWGCGLNAGGLFSNNNSDILGIAVAYEFLNSHSGSETTFELTYQRQIFRSIFIQPDFQYIIHPSGRIENINNCLAAMLRVGLSF
jgi:porin